MGAESASLEADDTSWLGEAEVPVDVGEDCERTAADLGAEIGRCDQLRLRNDRLDAGVLGYAELSRVGTSAVVPRGADELVARGAVAFGLVAVFLSEDLDRVGALACVVWDLRGHGLAQPLAGKFSYRGAVLEFIALLNPLGCEKAILVGQSMGGCAVQEVAFLHPKRVAAVVLIGSACATAEFSNLDNPEFFNSLLEEFLREGAPTRG